MKGMTHLALGTPVVYTERAAMARKGSPGMWTRGWHLPEKGNGEIPRGVVEHGGELVRTLIGGNVGREVMRFVNEAGNTLPPEAIEKYNKAVVVWQESGSGIVCGLETKQYGISSPSSGQAEDFDQGYFTTYGKVQLYVVRWKLEGRQFVHVPVWAAQPMMVPA